MYSTIVVGTDGSDSSLLAVGRAACIAAAFDAELLITSAYFSDPETVQVANRGETRPVVGGALAEEVLASARRAAELKSAAKISTVMREGSPVEVLMAVISEFEADLLVVGNRGINSLTGRLLGSVPADVARQSDCDVMIVHTVPGAK